jgi:hypothetical protein
MHIISHYKITLFGGEGKKNKMQNPHKRAFCGKCFMQKKLRFGAQQNYFPNK